MKSLGGPPGMPHQATTSPNTALSSANAILEQKQKKIDELNRRLERTVAGE